MMPVKVALRVLAGLVVSNIAVLDAPVGLHVEMALDRLIEDCARYVGLGGAWPALCCGV